MDEGKRSFCSVLRMARGLKMLVVLPRSFRTTVYN